MSSAIMPTGKLLAANISTEVLQSYSLLNSMEHVTLVPGEDFASHLLCLNLKFDSFNKRGRKINGKSIAMTLILTYFPCDKQDFDQFCTVLDSMLNTINVNTQIIISSDINSQIGTHTCEELGPFGIPQHNAQGENLLHVLAAHKL